MQIYFLLSLFLFFTSPELRGNENSFKEHSSESLLHDTEESFSFGEDRQDFQAKFFKMLTVLSGILLFMIIGAFSLKRLMHSRLTQTNRDSTIQILESRPLSNKTMLYLLEVEGERVVIAETSTSVSLLYSNHLKNEL